MKENPWDMARQQLRETALLLGLDDNMVNVLSDCKRAVTVSIPVRMDDGAVRAFEGFRVTHNVARGPSKGGLLYHPRVTADHMRALAMSMTWKCALMGLPFGGAKGAVVCDPKLLSRGELERLTRRYTSEIVNLIGPEVDIPAPDIGTNAQVMAWMFDTYSMNKGYSVLGVVTGKPIHLGGSAGREEGTARGVAVCLREAIGKREKSVQGLRVAVQGFGSVGRNLAAYLAEEGALIIALSDSRGGVYKPEGIDVPVAVAHAREVGKLAGLAGTAPVTNDELLLLDCDVLAPCAVGQMIHGGNAREIKASVVCECANGAVTLEAHRILTERRVLALPDILVNAGGSIVDYFEWVQGLQEYFWKEAEVTAKLDEIITRAFSETWGAHEERGLSLRQAAYVIAVSRVAEATTTRGLYP